MKDRFDSDAPRTAPDGRPTVRQRLKSGAWLLVLILLLIFIFQNLQSVHMDYFGWDLQWPLAILFIITLFVGILIGWALGRFIRWQPRKVR